MSDHTENQPRLPSQDSSMRVLRASGLPIHTVIDVGILRGTPFLRDNFADVRHVLIEPVTEFREQIEAAYAGLDDVIYVWAAAGAEPASGSLHVRRRHKDYTITHSALVAKNSPASDVRDVTVTTVDRVRAEYDLDGPFLLKIDVDGKDLEVMQGAEETLAETNCVVIEAPPHAIPERVAFLAARGFRLWDVVGFLYYRGVLWQVDLVFVRDAVARTISGVTPRLFPPLEMDGFEPLERTLEQQRMRAREQGAQQAEKGGLPRRR